MHRSSSSSPLHSPARKRQRMSSPTYDEQLEDVTQADLEAFDALDAKLSQSPKKGSQASSQEIEGQRDQDKHPRSSSTARLADDPDNPFTAGFASANTTGPDILPGMLLGGLGFGSSKYISPGITLDPREHQRSPSPEAPPEQDFDSWFQPTSIVPPLAFQTAKLTAPPETVTTPALGFSTASNKGWIAPSSVALAKAHEKMKEIWQETDEEPAFASFSDLPSGSENMFRTVSSTSHSAQRPALRPVQNSLNSPCTPTPQGFSRPSVAATPIPSSSSRIVTKVKPFKSPLLSPHVVKSRAGGSISGVSGSPLNPNVRSIGLPTFASSGSQPPMSVSVLSPAALDAQTSISTPGSSSFTTPARPSSLRVRTGPRRNTPAPFTTPFKPGMKPGQPGHARLEEKANTTAVAKSSVKLKENWLTRDRPSEGGKGIDRKGVFDLTIPQNRKTLALSGLLPQQYLSDKFEALGVNIAELTTITPNLAIYYHFHTSDRTPPSASLPSSQPIKLDATAALNQLLDRGCTLATKPWVDNHWSLILWKLAGMVALDPEREGNPVEKRWCWDEVMNQLLYRYERELNGGSRPPLRLITTQDAPAAYPMILCVSNITYSEPRLTDDNPSIGPHPELEVSDGWYRLRAQVDAPLARAIRRGVIRIGRKIGIAGARLSTERKDPSEVLEAYGSTKLILSGNSSHLAPWHAKLGFTAGPCVSTMHSLTGDGGIVACMDIVVLKAYPIAFLEFIEDQNGQKLREGPRNENEEAQVNENWKKRHELEASKLHGELEKRFNRYESYIERLERRAGPHFQPGENDSPPDRVESLYDELEDPADAGRVFSSTSPSEAGWLARHIRSRLEKERETAGEEIDRELKDLCPPRDVRGFRILIVQDSCTRRRPANRKAQLTVWDALSLSFSEDKAAGTFSVGQRYLVTHLMPTQQNAWMDQEPGSEIYLCTRRDSRWTPIKL